MDNEVMLQLYEYVNKLYEVVVLNVTSINNLEELTQAVGRTARDTSMKMEILIGLCVKTFGVMGTELDKLIATQGLMLELLQSVSKMAMGSMLLGIWNTATIAIIFCMIIHLNNKIKRLK